VSSFIVALKGPGGTETDMALPREVILSASLTSDSLDILDMRLDALLSTVDGVDAGGAPKSGLPNDVPVIDAPREILAGLLIDNDF